ncbi:exopolysaccharide biosynthesis polyprenyl glycosylphosphotransferase [Leeuwenhoekiella marinoflava]|uniref:Colanic acid biosysnthesis UDP-glucose lipid carrier transferase n=2 Tax=Leeuwenhoekiella marinoflava TaxID=988 RepID=A0ABY1HKY0_9FLAO|nr:exopolysaccharide biosynthesis polyprenyl glycosylphosphotransferase [Leeuwenhoekiella marinoflava]RXG32954.1 putative colanic acid biosynthesis UDP-glucose lipid carrier transferase [Leeuwenhoekiella marinoflava]SHE33268.1 putative colanic acid biosysnthesis UDP-glucose lipid carrier transferase [Leeuwenhoekiella marinoflava DSM 3653]
MNVKGTKHNHLLQPIVGFIDISTLLILGLLFDLSTPNYKLFAVYITFAWLVTTVGFGFYKVYRFTPFLKILSKIFRQFLLLILCLFTFFGIFNEIDIVVSAVLEYACLALGIIALIKILIFNLRKKYRKQLGGDTIRVIILGKNPKTEQLKNFFRYNPAYGFQFVENFDLRSKEASVDDVINFTLKNSVHQIYCSVAELKNKEIKELIQFADNNLIALKFLPDNKDIFTKKMDFQYYGITPILALRTLPIDTPVNLFLKRFLDIVFSSLVIVFILSWLTPLLALIIPLSSKGPLFFRQKRNGIEGTEFYCYKFRSMTVNKDANNLQACKNDMRTTKLGKFLRRTSIDELPQFYNVFMGDMSVVGPRPHMVSHTHSFKNQVDKFMVRHLVKPGITGLAQVSGYRGGIETKLDIKNRVRFDIFYVENWSILMDLRIIAKTFFQVIYGDKKAY